MRDTWSTIWGVGVGTLALEILLVNEELKEEKKEARI